MDFFVAFFVEIFIYTDIGGENRMTEALLFKKYSNKRFKQGALHHLYGCFSLRFVFKSAS